MATPREVKYSTVKCLQLNSLKELATKLQMPSSIKTPELQMNQFISLPTAVPQWTGSLGKGRCYPCTLGSSSRLFKENFTLRRKVTYEPSSGVVLKFMNFAFSQNGRSVVDLLLMWQYCNLLKKLNVELWEYLVVGI